MKRLSAVAAAAGLVATVLVGGAGTDQLYAEGAAHGFTSRFPLGEDGAMLAKAA